MTTTVTQFEAIEVVRVRGNLEKIRSEDRFEGVLLEFVPHPNGTADLMLPITKLVEAQEAARKRGVVEPRALGKEDIRNRSVLQLTATEARRALALRPGETHAFTRRGWGQVWRQRIRRIPLLGKPRAPEQKGGNP